MKSSILKLLAIASAPLAAQAAEVVVNANITTDTTWSSANTYIIDGRVFVTNDAELTIEAGTVIKGRPRAPQDASALVIARDGTINAVGTPDDPIIFTAEADDLLGGLTQADRGLWGGVVILGEAINNREGSGGEGNIEGIPTTEPLGVYGGTNDADNSGVFQYVSIRHAGSLLGPDNELNGLTLGSVGSGTTIDHVEVFANADDGFEFFGGSVNVRYLVSAFNDDDAFDWDEGYHGNMQFLFAIQDPSVGNHAFESDGGTNPEDGMPYSQPIVSNYTAIGSGATGTNANSIGPIFRDNTGGIVYNSIFHDFKGYAWRIETDSSKTTDSADRLAAGDIDIGSNIFGTFGAGDTNDALFKAVDANGEVTIVPNYTAAHITDAAQNNSINTDPLLVSISRSKNGMLDPRLQATSPALAGADFTGAPAFFTTVAYRGAFDGDSNWAYDWTKLGEDGYFAPVVDTSGDPVIINRDSPSEVIAISTRSLLSADEVMIAGFVIQGSQSQTVIIRAMGPYLASLGVPNAHPDPFLELYNASGTKIAENDDWNTNQALDIGLEVGLGGPEAGSTDAVIIATLPPGLYTAQVHSKGLAGDVIVEVYEVD